MASRGSGHREVSPCDFPIVPSAVRPARRGGRQFPAAGDHPARPARPTERRHHRRQRDPTPGREQQADHAGHRRRRRADHQLRRAGLRPADSTTSRTTSATSTVTSPWSRPTAYPLLTAGRLDKRLFNLTELAAQGYDDASSAQLPLLLTAPATLRSAPQHAGGRDAPPYPRQRRKHRGHRAEVRREDVLGRHQRPDHVQDQPGHQDLARRPHPRHARPVDEADRRPDRLAARGTTARGVKVAVLDTGYDAEPPRPRQAGRRGRRASSPTRRSRTSTATAPTPRRSSPASVRRPTASARASRRARNC